MSYNEARKAIELLLNRPKFEKMIGFCSLFTSLMEKHRLHPVIVGGLAVEIYSRSEYTTSDIDIIFEQRDIADQCFHELGFVRSGRHWYHAGLGISVWIHGPRTEVCTQDGCGMITRKPRKSSRAWRSQGFRGCFMLPARIPGLIDLDVYFRADIVADFTIAFDVDQCGADQRYAGRRVAAEPERMLRRQAA